jgi:hypothetical protein
MVSSNGTLDPHALRKPCCNEVFRLRTGWIVKAVCIVYIEEKSINCFYVKIHKNVMGIYRLKKMKRKKGEITIKIPRKELETVSTYERVKAHLKKHTDYAYTRSGLLVEIYGYNKHALNTSFANWPEGAPIQYNRIRLSLKRLEKEDLIQSKKQGRKFLYWWKCE